MRRVVILLACILAGTAVIVSGFIPISAPFIINDSESAPIGLYRIVEQPIERGTWVSVQSATIKADRKLPPRMLKSVAGIPGDTVIVTLNGVYINSHYQGSAPIFGKPCTINRTLLPGEVFLLNNHPRSFDSRYFGPVSVSECTPLQPVLVYQ